MIFPNLSLNTSDGFLTLNIGKRTFIHTVNEWAQFRGGFNWVTFRFLHLSFENDLNFAPGYEAEAVVLGLGLRYRYNKPEFEEKMKSIGAPDELFADDETEVAK